MISKETNLAAKVSLRTEELPRAQGNSTMVSNPPGWRATRGKKEVLKNDIEEAKRIGMTVKKVLSAGLKTRSIISKSQK